MTRISEFLGIPVAASLFGIIVASFAALDRWSSRQAKKDLTDYLKGTDFGLLSAKLPQVVQSVFNRMFGDRHFSRRSILMSIAVSVSTIVMLLAIAIAIDGFKAWHAEGSFLSGKVRGYWVTYFLDKSSAVSFGSWVLWSLVIDYANLFKTRVVIRILQKVHLGALASLLLIVVDFALGILVFFIGISLLFATMMIVSGGVPSLGIVEDTFFQLALVFGHLVLVANSLDAFSRDVWVLSYTLVRPLSSFSSILFCAGMLPSAWLWLYLFSAMATKVIGRSTRGINFLTYALDVDEHPIQSIGIVGAMLVSGIYLIILGIVSLSGGAG